jgi:hypothetical protein
VKTTPTPPLAAESLFRARTTTVAVQSAPPPAQYNTKQWLNDKDFCIQVGRSMFQSLAILGLGLGASETEIKVDYRQLARKYHPA